MNLIIVLLDFFAALFFLVAFLFSVKNYFETRSFGVYWMLFSMAMLLGFFFAGLTALEWLGFYSEILDEIQEPIFASMATALSITALVGLHSPIKPIQ